MKRTYKIKGNIVDRQIWWDFLTTGDWTEENLTKPSIPKVTNRVGDGTVPVTPERAKEIRQMSTKRLQND